MNTAGVAAIVLATAAIGGSSVSVRAHEFWLEPTNFAPAVGTSVPITIRIGQNFAGDTYPFLKEDFKRFSVVDRRGEKPVKGVDGDDPAVTMKFPEPGLATVIHYTTSESVRFDTWDEFESYLKSEGLEHIAEKHRESGRPMRGIKEIYYRCAKLLMNVADGAGEDLASGLPLELVAERNPYKLREGDMLPVRLLFNGKPIAGIQIMAMNKTAPDKREIVRTDSDGRALVPLPMSGTWLLNAVHMIVPAARDKADWTSYWASMTFARP